MHSPNRRTDYSTIWRRSLRCYSLLTGCERGRMPYGEVLTIDRFDARRRGQIRRELEKISVLAYRRDMPRRGIWSRVMRRCGRPVIVSPPDISGWSAQDTLNVLTADLFHYSDQMNGRHALWLLSLWRRFEALLPLHLAKGGAF